MLPLRTTRDMVHRIVEFRRTEHLWSGMAKRVERSRVARGGGLDDTGASGDADAAEQWRALRVRLGALAELFAELRLGVTVTDACAALGVADRDALSRELAHRRLPPYRLLKNWCQVVAMAQHAAVGTSLCDLALQRGEYPAAYYRLVRSTTGHPWTVVESRGLVWLTRLALQAWAPHTSS